MISIDLTPVAEKEWYKANNCEHGHCPEGCEHPQPYMFEGQLICGSCAFKYETKTLMVPCTPTNCD